MISFDEQVDDVSRVHIKRHDAVPDEIVGDLNVLADGLNRAGVFVGQRVDVAVVDNRRASAEGRDSDAIIPESPVDRAMIEH